LFHAVSAFCNAGFSLYSDSFMRARSNPWVNIILISLIVSGGLGFTVLINLFRRAVRRKKERITVQTKLVLITSLILILFGAVNIYLLERDALFMEFSHHERFFASLFQSVTTRTAGFNTVDTSALRPRTLFVMSILMFIGASPGSTGGGIKTTTFFILILSIITILRDQRFNTIFKRRIPYAVINRAIAILVSAIGMIIFGTLLLSISEKFSFIQIYFETVSAFGTVGLSTGITSHLSDFGKIIIIVCMFIGRLGPLTMVLAIRNVQSTRLVTYPEERVMVG
jgi:trk system potassium uptake protein TrkH